MKIKKKDLNLFAIFIDNIVDYHKFLHCQELCFVLDLLLLSVRDFTPTESRFVVQV